MHFYDVVDPANPFATLPFAFPLIPLDVNESGYTVLEAILEVTFVDPSIGVLVHAVPMLLVLEEAALVGATIGPCVDALAVHVVLEPAAFEDAAIAPVVSALAGDHVLAPLPVEDAVVGPGVDAISVLHSIHVAADVPGTVLPDLFSLTLLYVLDPFTLVS